jgi:hypothetical protein
MAPLGNPAPTAAPTAGHAASSFEDGLLIARPDRTRYLMDRLAGPPRKLLLERRRPDFTAVRVAVAAGVDESALLAAASLPMNFDADRALELWQRAWRSFADVDLP